MCHLPKAMSTNMILTTTIEVNFMISLFPPLAKFLEELIHDETCLSTPCTTTQLQPPIGHLQAAVYLGFRASPSAQPFKWK